jgi:hypothetical protein
MFIALKIYLIGFVATFCLCIKVLEEEGQVGWDDILFSFSIALLSWVGFIALVLGNRLKNNS